LFFQKLSRRTILVADQTRRPQYQQLVLRTFFLANSDPEKAKQLVGQAIPPSVGRPQTIVVADKDTNSLTIRDTAENVRLIGELIQSIDKDRAEVVMDVNIYEISRSDLMQFGNQWGSDGTLLNIGGIQKGFSVLQGGVGTVGLPVSLGTALMIPSSAFAALQAKNQGKLVASTQVHAFNGEESTARIGQRVPVQTAQAYPFGVQTSTGTTNNGFPTGGFPVINYEPTGLTLKFTPQVFPNQDVQVKMSIESKDVLGASTLTPTFTERTITGTARVQNNRTMMLASVSTDITSEGRKGLPILSGLPILGRLFSAPTRDDRRIDIVIAVTPRVLRAPAVTPRDLEMRPSGTLQSPTTGSLEAMLREADREDQLAELRLQQKNANLKVAEARPSTSLPGVFPSNASTGVSGGTVAQTPLAPAANNAVAMNVAKNSSAESAAASRPPATTPNPTEEMPAFVPAPKSLVSSTAATEVAAVNTNLTSNAGAALTSMTAKPIEAAITPISPKGRAAQLSFGPADQSMKVGETRRFALDVKSDVALAMAIVALRFDPKVVKVRAIGLDGSRAMLTQSSDASGVCLISISNLSNMTGSGTLIYIDVEGIGPGDAGLLFDKESSHLVAIDARDLGVEVTTARATVKQ
jgi:general secretion pathway protein D